MCITPGILRQGAFRDNIIKAEVTITGSHTGSAHPTSIWQVQHPQTMLLIRVKLT
jgi:hypothetical protein